SYFLKCALVEEVRNACRALLKILDSYTDGKPEEDPFAAEIAIWKMRENGVQVPDNLKIIAAEAPKTHKLLEKSFENAFTSLRMLASADLAVVLQNASVVENILKKDPAGVYPTMDEKSRV